MTEPIRIPLVAQLTPRQADSNRDALASNIFYDKNTKGDIYATKRPGLTSYASGFGQAFGIYSNFGFNLDLIWRQVIWNGSTFLAVSDSQFYPYPNLVISSTDGITWSQSYQPINASWQGVAWNGTKYCSVSAFSGIASTSTDGVSWVEHDSGLGFAAGIAAKNGGNFVGISTLFPPLVRYSSDGISWATGDLPSGHWGHIAYSSTPNRFVVVSGVAGENSYYSSTGATWTINTLPTGIRFGLCTSNTTFFTPTYNSSVGHISTDGITWSQVTLPETRNWSDCCWTGTHFLVLSEDPETTTSVQYVATSTDGITWTETALPLPTFGITLNGYTTIAGNTSIIVVLADGNSFAYSTDNGLSYSQGDLGRYQQYPFTSTL